MRYIHHPELKNRIRVQDFQGQEPYFQKSKKKSRCFVIRYLLCHTCATQIKIISGNNSHSGKAPNLNFSRQLKERQEFLLRLQDIKCFQFKIILIQKWHICGRPILNPFTKLGNSMVNMTCIFLHSFLDRGDCTLTLHHLVEQISPRSHDKHTDFP